MNYLVMECHRGYAVVLDESGRFIKVANRNYQVGQTVTDVIAAQPIKFAPRRWIAPLTAVACLILLIVGSWQFLVAPYGSVRIKINPDVQMTVNRLDRVISVEGLNADGIALVEGYSPHMKTVEQVSDELADRAVSMGYLSSGGSIYLDVESTKADWVVAIQDRLINELCTHMNDDTISIQHRDAHHDGEDDDDWDDDWEDILEDIIGDEQPDHEDEDHDDDEDCDDHKDDCDSDEDDDDSENDEEDDD